LHEVGVVQAFRPAVRFPMNTRFIRAALAMGGLLTGIVANQGVPRVDAQSAPAPLSYTAAQADRERGVYAERCASRLGEFLHDGQSVAPLRGVWFRSKWGGGSAEARITYMTANMPPERPGSLGAESYTQVLAFMLQENGVQAGERELPADSDGLRAMASPNW